jgi:hypothetical protein
VVAVDEEVPSLLLVRERKLESVLSWSCGLKGEGARCAGVRWEMEASLGERKERETQEVGWSERAELQNDEEGDELWSRKREWRWCREGSRETREN